MTTDELRAKFEAHFRDKLLFDFRRNILTPNNYASVFTDGAWSGWQAAHASRDAEVEALKKRVDELDDSEWRLIKERDAAEGALSDMFSRVTGRDAGWSNLWGFEDAVEEAEEHVEALRRDAERYMFIAANAEVVTSGRGMTVQLNVPLLDGKRSAEDHIDAAMAKESGDE